MKIIGEVVHWKRNMFSAPFGNAGERFVLDLSRLFRAYAEGLAFEFPKACKL